MKINSYADMQKQQKKLQKLIKTYKEDTFDTIVDSILDEILEFKRETVFNYKTWKEFKRDDKKALEEYVDIWFMFLKLMTYSKINIENIRREWWCSDYNTKNSLRTIAWIVTTIHKLDEQWAKLFLDELNNIGISYLNIDENGLFEAFEQKLIKNYERIGKEWL